MFLHSDARYKQPTQNPNNLTIQPDPEFSINASKKCEKSSSTAQNVHKWVYDLKGLDNSKDFSKMFLVVVRGDTSKIDHLSWEQVKNLTQNDILAAITSVLFIPRRSYGQLYIVKGLNSSLHFSLGSIGQQALSTYLNTNSINEYIMNGHETLMKNKLNNNVHDCGVFVKTATQHKKSQIEQGYYKLMIDMACHLWGNLLGVS